MATGSTGTSIGGVFAVGNRLGELLPSVSIEPVSQANEVIPLPGYESMLGNATTAPPVGIVGGTGTVIYATRLGNPEYMAKWVNGSLAAYKTPADATQQDQFRAQCIGGSASVCYTTENNNEIVLRDGSLNLTSRFRRTDIEQFLGPNNPANGISNFVFTGIGGR